MCFIGARNIVLKNVRLGFQRLRTLQGLSSCKWTLEMFILCSTWLALLNVKIQTSS